MSGNVERARVMLSEAPALYESIGMPDYGRRKTRHAMTCPPRRQQRGAPPGLLSLAIRFRTRRLAQLKLVSDRIRDRGRVTRYSERVRPEVLLFCLGDLPALWSSVRAESDVEQFACRTRACSDSWAARSSRGSFSRSRYRAQQGVVTMICGMSDFLGAAAAAAK